MTVAIWIIAIKEFVREMLEEFERVAKEDE